MQEKMLQARLFGLRMLQILIAVFLGLVAGAIGILWTGNPPLTVYYEMFEKSFFQLYYFLQTLTRAVPIAFSALGVIISWRAGYINLGVEGQMIVGGLVSTVLGLWLPFPAPLTLLLSIFGGMAAGACYALLAAFLYRKFHVPLVICTLMMNYIASNVAAYFVTYPLKDSVSTLAIQTAKLPADLQFPVLVEGTTFHAGFLLLVGVLLLLLFVIHHTRFGYESKMTGLNAEFARYGGIEDGKLLYRTMALSGAIAALGGICEIYGGKMRYVNEMFTSASYAWTGLMAALIAHLSPMGAFFSSIFLSMLQVGGQSIQRTLGIPLHLATIIQSGITLFVSIQLFGGVFRTWRERIQRRAARKAVREGGEK